MKIVAIALIVFGLLGIVWGGITYTRSEKVVDIGPLEVRKDKKTDIPIPPLVGVAGVGLGIFLLSRARS
jgi:hypothetical protein